jgi:hypothetical protein
MDDNISYWRMINIKEAHGDVISAQTAKFVRKHHPNWQARWQVVSRLENEDIPLPISALKIQCKCLSLITGDDESMKCSATVIC